MPTNWFGEFSDPELELEYRDSRTEQTARSLGFALRIGAAAFLLFSVLEVSQSGLTSTVIILFGARVALAVLVALLSRRIDRDPTEAHSFRFITLIESWAIGCHILTSVLQPEDVRAHNLSFLVLVGSLCIFVPNRWINSTVLCVVAVPTYLCIASITVDQRPSDWTNDVMSLSIATIVFATVAWRFEMSGRKEYALLVLERRSNEHLIAEITRRQALEDELTWMANHDSLSDLLNRRAFFEQAEREMARARRTGLPVSIVVLDADEFKAINDRFGHHAGDEAIKRIAAMCKFELRADDLVGRIGGEEFAAVLPAASLHLANEVATRLCAAIRETEIDHPLGRLPLSVSIGVTECRPWEETMADALQRADEALFDAKRQGRDCVVPV